MKRSLLLTVPIVLAGCDRREVPPDDPGTRAPIDLLELPGDRLFPEGIAASTDGRLYIGSSVTGEILTVAPGTAAVEPWLAPDPLEPRPVRGLAVDRRSDLLWFCTVAPQRPSTVEAYDLSDALPVYSFPLPDNGRCSDVAVAEDGTVYATDDATYQVWRVPPDRSALEPWLTQSDLVSVMFSAGVGPSGIAVLGNRVWITLPDDGRVAQYEVTASGAPALSGLSESALGALDGLALHGDDALVAVDGRGSLLRLPLEDDLYKVQELLPYPDGPTSVAVVGDDAWVAEGQLHEREGGKPSLPFRVVRIPVGP